MGAGKEIIQESTAEVERAERVISFKAKPNQIKTNKQQPQQNLDILTSCISQALT